MVLAALLKTTMEIRTTERKADLSGEMTRVGLATRSKRSKNLCRYMSVIQYAGRAVISTRGFYKILLNFQKKKVLEHILLVTKLINNHPLTQNW